MSHVRTARSSAPIRFVRFVPGVIGKRWRIMLGSWQIGEVDGAAWRLFLPGLSPGWKPPIPGAEGFGGIASAVMLWGLGAGLNVREMPAQ